MPQDARSKDRRFFLFNAVLSTAALGFLAWLLLLRPAGDNTTDLSFMPALNAGFNSLATLLLCGGYLAIRRNRRTLHQYMMVSAFAASALFLAGYIVYHYFHGADATEYSLTQRLLASFFTNYPDNQQQQQKEQQQNLPVISPSALNR